MNSAAGSVRALVLAMLCGALAACNAPPSASQDPLPLEPAAQDAAAEKVARAFAGVCLTEADPDAATRALRAAGWPPFNTVWRNPTGVFYAAPPSPAGLFVTVDRPWRGVTGAQRFTCAGHYLAKTAAPMIAALARRWGPALDGEGPYRGQKVWALHVKAGVVTPLSATPVVTPAQAALLASDEAYAIAQVQYNPALNDVASLIVLHRRAPATAAPPRLP